MVYAYSFNIDATVILIFSTLNLGLISIIIKAIKKETQDELSNILEVLDNFENSLLENEINLYDETLVSKYHYKLFNLLYILKTKAEDNKTKKDELQKIVATISHQAKNSLTIITNYYELKKPEHYDENDFVIKNEIDKMNFLFENLIKIARVEVSDITLKLEPIDINKLCLKLIKDTYRLATDKNITIDFSPTSEQLVLADLNWTMEALYNILHNAIKYSQNNSKIEITITKYYSFHSIKVKDYGTGIEKEDLKNIFHKFYRGENSQDFEGLGIGLFLSQEIVNRQGGFIKVSSNISEYTEFEIFFKNFTNKQNRSI